MFYTKSDVKLYVRASFYCISRQNRTLQHCARVQHWSLSAVWHWARVQGALEPFTERYPRNSAIWDQFYTKIESFFKQMALGSDYFWPKDLTSWPKDLTSGPRVFFRAKSVLQGQECSSGPSTVLQGPVLFFRALYCHCRALYCHCRAEYDTFMLNMTLLCWIWHFYQFYMKPHGSKGPTWALTALMHGTNVCFTPNYTVLHEITDLYWPNCPSNQA